MPTEVNPHEEGSRQFIINFFSLNLRASNCLLHLETKLNSSNFSYIYFNVNLKNLIVEFYLFFYFFNIHIKFYSNQMLFKYLINKLIFYTQL